MRAMDIGEWLLAQYDVDEADAVRAQQRSDGDLWVVTGPDNAVGVNYDPSFIRADLAAKRAIVKLHTGNHECPAWRQQTAEDIADGEPRRTYTTYVHPDFEADDPTLRLLALPLAEREGYDPAWRPTD